jgi:hypothetical protein
MYTNSLTGVNKTIICLKNIGGKHDNEIEKMLGG